MSRQVVIWTAFVMQSVMIQPLLANETSERHPSTEAKTQSIGHKLDQGDWNTWRIRVQEAILPIFLRLRQNHPELKLAGDEPCEISFDVTDEQHVGHIRVEKKSRAKNFDEQVCTTLFCARHSFAYPFPEGVNDKFVKCRISFYPNGKLSELAVISPKPDETYTDDDIAVPVDGGHKASPPEVDRISK